MSKATIVDVESVERDYGFAGTIAVIDHADHGRLLIMDGYGGERSLSGGAVRWVHGSVFKLQPADTLDSLRNEVWNDGMTLLEAVQHSLDTTRPLLDWKGTMVAACAKSAGL
jgi:hypothetical protein